MKAPVFLEDGEVEEPLRVTAFHNGILIHDDVWVYGEVGGPYKKHGKRPLMIQDHKGTGVSFRNIWIVEDAPYEQSLSKFRKLYLSKLIPFSFTKVSNLLVLTLIVSVTCTCG